MPTGQAKPKGAKGMGRMFDITDDLDSIPYDPNVELEEENGKGVAYTHPAPFRLDPGRLARDHHMVSSSSLVQPPDHGNEEVDGQAVPEAPCEKPGFARIPLSQLCALPPVKGTGRDDVFRYYYNPVVRMCIPFSYSGKGGEIICYMYHAYLQERVTNFF